MKKEIALGAVVLILVIAGIVFYAASHPTTVKAPGTGGTATTTGGFLPAVGPYTENTQYYQIAVNYPTSTPRLASLGATADASATALMRSYIADSVAQFKVDMGTLPYPGQSHPDSFSIVYLIGSSHNTVSYIFTTNEDTGGAHGNTFFKTFVFDTTTGANLSLGDFFTSGADYLGTLSQMSRAKLPDVIGQSADFTFIKDGTTPDAKNFQNFFIDATDFVLLFPPYQVASYAQGPITLRIPKQQLWSILKSQYR